MRGIQPPRSMLYNSSNHHIRRSHGSARCPFCRRRAGPQPADSQHHQLCGCPFSSQCLKRIGRIADYGRRAGRSRQAHRPFRRPGGQHRHPQPTQHQCHVSVGTSRLPQEYSARARPGGRGRFLFAPTHRTRIAAIVPLQRHTRQCRRNRLFSPSRPPQQRH